MEREFTFGKTEENTKEVITMTRNTVRANTIGQMARYLRVSGSKAKDREKVNI